MNKTNQTSQANKTNPNGKKNQLPKKKEYLLPDEPVPEDIHWEWLEVIKAAQAACKDNGGYAQFTMTLSVHHNKPVLWIPPAMVEIEPENAKLPRYQLLKLSPKRVSLFRFTSEIAAHLMSLYGES